MSACRDPRKFSEWGHCAGVIERGEPPKPILSPSVITSQNLVALCHTTWAYVPPNLGHWGPSLYRGSAWWTSNNFPSPADVLPCQIWSFYRSSGSTISGVQNLGYPEALSPIGHVPFQRDTSSIDPEDFVRIRRQLFDTHKQTDKRKVTNAYVLRCRRENPRCAG